MKRFPPQWAVNFIDWLTANGPYADIPGDLWEEFEENKATKSLEYARRRYVWTVITCLRPFILREKFNFNPRTSNPMMLSNYWIVTRRFILKNKLYAGINILGLAIGIACSLVLLIYISNEISYDRFHHEADQIYRLLVTNKDSESETTSSIITAAIAPTLKEELPEVLNYARFSFPSNGFLALDDKKVNVSNLLYADSTLFDVFSFDLISGDKSTCLASPYSIILTPKLAKSIFGEENPIGKTILLNGEQPLMIRGIIKEAPTNSQIQYSCLVSFSTLEKEGYYLGWNGGWNYFEYVKLAVNTPIEDLKAKLPPILDKNINNMLKQFESEWIVDFQPLLDIHLSSLDIGDWPSKGNIDIIYVFGGIAFLTLFMAIVNFINLTISQSINRLKEIGVRKSIGGTQKMLVSQFLFESFLYSIISMIVAFVLMGVFYNMINEFLGYKIDQIYLSNLGLVLIISMIVMIVSIGSGAYPAFYLSSLSSIASLRTRYRNQTSKPSKIDKLVVFQFFISILLMVSTWFIYNQLQFVSNKSLGYKKENVMILKLNSNQASKNYKTLKVELSKIPRVFQSGASSDYPGDGFTSNGYIPEGRELPVMIHVLDIDDSYLKTMDIDIVSGRNFSNDLVQDKEAILVNEALVKEMGWKDPIGKTIKRDGEHKIIGVVKDFNYSSLHEKIAPLIFTMAPWKDQFSFLSVRIGRKNIPGTIEKIEETWRLVNPTDPFEFNFLDQEFDALYSKEQQQAKLLFIFSMIAILIGSMGLVGIVSYTLKHKTKEIGIRKVMGASTLSLITGVSMKYIMSILIGSVLAIPLAYTLINQWLANFYYRINLNPIVFVCSVLIVLLLAFVIINVQTISVVRKNPTESLQYE